MFCYPLNLGITDNALPPLTPILSPPIEIAILPLPALIPTRPALSRVHLPRDEAQCASPYVIDKLDPTLLLPYVIAHCSFREALKMILNDESRKLIVWEGGYCAKHKGDQAREVVRGERGGDVGRWRWRIRLSEVHSFAVGLDVCLRCCLDGCCVRHWRFDVR